MKTNFYTYQGVVRALDGIDLDMEKGEVLGLVGETGCGKSVTALSVLRLIPSPPGKVEEGEALFNISEEGLRKLESLRSQLRKHLKAMFGDAAGLSSSSITLSFLTRVEEIMEKAAAVDLQRRQQVLSIVAELRNFIAHYDLLSKDETQLREIRGNNISMIFQEPMQALNPVFTIGDQVSESIILHRRKTLYRSIIARMRREILRKRVSRRLRKDFSDQLAAVPNVDLSELTRSDLTEVLEILSKRVSANSSLASDVRELTEIEDAGSAGTIESSIFSRFLPKTIQWRLYMKQWLRSGWNASDVLTELSKIAATKDSSLRRETLWSQAETADDGSLYLTPTRGTAPEELVNRLSPILGASRSSFSSQTVLGDILESPRVEGSRVRLRVKDGFRAPKRGLADLLLEKIPFLKKALLYPLKRQALDEAVELLRLLKISDPERVINEYPHELSGGMQQRALIAIALSCDPLLLIADEPTTALDVTIQAQILELLRTLKRAGRPSILIITHDLGVIADMCDRVCVMYGGVIVENASVKEIFKNPLHPYTQGLLKAIPSHAQKRERLEVIKGFVPNLIYPPSGCRFHPRCPAAMPHCGWDARDMEEIIKKLVDTGEIRKEAIASYSISTPNVLKIVFVPSENGERAMSLLQSRIEADRKSSVPFGAITSIGRDGNSLVLTLMEARRPSHLEVSPGHEVSCYLYEKPVGVS